MDRFCCKKTRKMVIDVCEDMTCPWKINAENFLNCTWVACKYGPFTLEEVGNMMGVTRERIRQIENQALKKLRRNNRKHLLEGYEDHYPEFYPEDF